MQPTARARLEKSALVTEGSALLQCWINTSYKVTSPKSRNVTDLPNTDTKTEKTGKMRQCSGIFEAKEQEKTPEEELSEVEISNLPDKEFEVMITKMLSKLGREE